MNVFTEFVEELDMLPKIDTRFVYVGGDKLTKDGVEVEATTIRLHGKSREYVEASLIKEVKELIHGNYAWVRCMPTIVEVSDDKADEHGYRGYARIAVMAK